jgi:hypothetical protein
MKFQYRKYFPIRFSLAALIATVGATAGLAVPAQSQDFIQDTLAVRILLDQNGLLDKPVSQVITAEGQRVTQLRLSGLGLVSLPPQIGALSALKYLVLSGNLLDSLPAETWSLGNLVELDLGGNRIGMLDARVGGLTKLLFLGLRGNGLTSLPASMFGLPQLEILLLTDNALDSIPEAIADLAFLRYADLSANRLTAVPYTLAAMDALDSLDLSGNLIETLPELITEMKASTKVRLGANRLCDLSPRLQAWAEGKEPGWFATQACGSPVRGVSARAAGPFLRAFSDGGFIRLDYAAPRGASRLEAVFTELSGRTVRSIPLTAASMAIVSRAGVSTTVASTAVPKSDLGARRFLWAQLRADGRTVAVAPVLP